MRGQGVRFGQPEQSIVNYCSERCVYLPDGRCRLYLYRRTEGSDPEDYCIISATSTDSSPLPTFVQDPGVRIAQRPFPVGAPLGTAYTPDVMWCEAEGYYRMYYSAWTDEELLGPRGYIMAATSKDGLDWRLSNGGQPIMYPGGPWDRVKCSNPSVIELPDGRARLFIEACDGSAEGLFGVWRISSQTSVVPRGAAL